MHGTAVGCECATSLRTRALRAARLPWSRSCRRSFALRRRSGSSSIDT